jgi:hypothetical protein
MGELEKERRRSDSLWGAIQAAFIDEGNDKDNAQFWADKVSSLVADWVNNRRANLNQRIMTTGAMPPYTDCLNELVISVAPPGSTPEFPPDFNPLYAEQREGPQLLLTSNAPQPYSPYQPNQLSSVHPSTMQPGAGDRLVPEHRRVNVPKPFATAMAANVPQSTMATSATTPLTLDPVTGQVP